MLNDSAKTRSSGGLEPASSQEALLGNDTPTTGSVKTPYLPSKPESTSHDKIPIAICGMAMRLPGGISSEQQLWDFLLNKQTARAPVPEERYNAEAFHGPDAQGNKRHGFFLSNMDLRKFDASPFSMTRGELEWLDPQVRVMLELTRECFENAGEVNWRGRKDIGCYVGTWGDDWKEIINRDPLDTHPFSVTGHMDFQLANKISFEYDLGGPSFVVKSACSSSLVALHQACRALEAGEIRSALVGGANLLLTPTASASMYQGGLVSPTDTCRTFDAAADGYCRAEGLNMIYIKRVDDALRDGTPIRAVIRATATNADGRGEGLFHPSAASHEHLIRSCYQAAGITEFGKTGHFECHGTGTKAGDPTETTAIANIFGSHGGVSIGSVKPNLGHSEGASGLTSVIKSVLALEHRIIPPNTNFETPNPSIPWEQGLHVPIEPSLWPKDRDERISINAFGLGGSNAHAILESSHAFGLPHCSRARTAPNKEKSFKLLVLTAHSPESGSEGAVRLVDYVRNDPESLGDVAYTLAIRREHHFWRTFAVTKSNEIPEFSAMSKIPTTVPNLGFVFTGQGSQWPQMGALLLREYPSCARDMVIMQKALSALEPGLAPSWTIEGELLKPKAESRVDRAEFSQPLCTAIQIMVVNLLKAWGVNPTAVIGHSSGEIAAAYACGALTIQEAIVSAYFRGFVTAKKSPRRGRMTAVGLGVDAIQPYLRDGVVVACENSPKSITLSGDAEALEQVVQSLENDIPGVFIRHLQVGIAYHSHHMREVGGYYEQLLQPHVSGKTISSIPMYSTVSGNRLDESHSVGPGYWRANLESPVRFNTTAQRMLKEQGSMTLVEIGPHAALRGPLRQIFNESRSASVYVPTLTRDCNEAQALLQTAGQLFLLGVGLDFHAINPGGQTLNNLPHYAWNRNAEYWHESRTAAEWRKRGFPHHELLGSRVFDCGPVEPVWRNVLRLDGIPWCRDHVIGRDAVLPATGFIVMACEALRQLSGADDYSFRNVALKSALLLHESSTIELVTSLRPLRLTNSLDSVWYEATISSFDGTSWTRHITAEVRGGSEHQHESREIHELPRKINIASWYRTFRKTGLKYGPIFQNRGRTSAHPLRDMVVSQISQSFHDVEGAESQLHYHPATLDLCFQLYQVAAVRGLERNCTSMCVPKYVKEFYLKRPTADGTITAEVVASATDTGSIHGGCYGIAGNGEVVFHVRGSEMAWLDNNSDNISSQDGPSAARLVWKPHIDFQQIDSLIVSNQQARLPYKDMQELLLLCCLEAAERLQRMGDQATLSVAPNFRRWLDLQITEARSKGFLFLEDTNSLLNLDSNERSTLLCEIANRLQVTSAGPTANAMHRIAREIEDVVGEKINTSDLFQYDDNSAHAFTACNTWDYSRFLRLLGHQKPHLKVIEIGAGTGETTELMVNGLLSEQGDYLFSSYTFTDIAADLVGAAQEKFRSVQRMDFQTCDITLDLEDQGFELESYDLVIAANVLYLTPRITDALHNVRKLLRPDGKLILQEMCPTLKHANFIMGIFPEWWVGEGEGRRDEPYIVPEEWAGRLSDAGFSGADAVFLDNEKPFQAQAVIIASPRTEERPQLRELSLLTSFPKGPVAQGLVSFFSAQGLVVELVQLPDDATHSIISILDLERESPFLCDMSDENFRELKRFLLGISSPTGLLWLTRPCQVRCSDPRYAQMLGLVRVLRNERDTNVITLELDEVKSSGSLGAILGVFQKLQQQRPGDVDDALEPDREFAWSNGALLIPRFSWISTIEELESDPYQKPEDISTSLEVGRRGFIQSLSWKETLNTIPFEEDDVLIDVRAVGLNFKDILIAMGIVGGNCENGSGLGCECSGIIKKVGARVTEFKVGDRVAALSVGSFSSVLKTRADFCVRIPNRLDFDAAATMPTVYTTVIYSLLELAKLQAGQTVLIHSACGGVGIAALHLCRMIGAKVYATVSSDEKSSHLTTIFGVPQNRIFNSRNTEFLHGIMQETGGKGVDVVLNSLSGELLHASWRCVAEFGCMIELGKRDFIGKGRLAMDAFEENRSFFGVHMVPIARGRPRVIRHLLDKMINLYEYGCIAPIDPMRVFDAVDIQEAFRTMQKGEHIGKFVVRMPTTTSPLQASPLHSRFSLRSDVSYLLVGGLGGLGRAISTWLVERGATNLLYLSPSAGKRASDLDLVQELAAAGCHSQLIQGNVANKSDVLRAFETARLPIGGILQMSMVLRDGMFENMTFDDWNTVTRPKIQGTWNLHEVSAEIGIPLDFFVLFSSASGVVGQRGQANYASANTFLDAFAQFRQHQGLPASVLDIGAVGEVGYVSNNQKLLDQNVAFSNYLLSEQDVIGGLELSLKSPSKATQARFTSSCKASFTSIGQLGLGLRTTKPLSSPQNRVIWKRDPRMSFYRNLEQSGESSFDGETAGDGIGNFRTFLTSMQSTPNALRDEETIETLTGHIRSTLAGFLIRSPEELDVNAAITALGVDSLLAIELKNWFRQRLSLDVSVLEVMSSGSLLGLSRLTGDRLLIKFTSS